MNLPKDLLKKAQKMLLCPVCKRRFGLQEIKLRDSFNNIYIFQTICRNHQPAVVTIFIADYKQNREQKNITPLGADEIMDFYQALDKFDGDFIKLWKKLH